MNRKLVKNRVLGMVLVLTLLLTMLSPGFTAFAEAPPEKSEITIHSIQFPAPGVGEPAPKINGDGTLIAPGTGELVGGTPNVGVEFHVIQIKAGYNMGENPTQRKAKAYYDSHKNDASLAKVTGSTNAAGEFATGLLPAGNYLIYKENTTGTIQSAVPIVIQIPMMKADGTGWNSDIHIYTKNVSTLGAATIYKFKGEEGITAPLAGAKFALYYVGDDEDKPIEKQLLTGNDGYTPVVSNLLPGQYYFVETLAPNGYLLNGKKYEFEVTTDDHAFDGDGELIDAKIIKIGSPADTKNNVPNYRAPSIDKKLLTSASADIGQINRWELTADIPANIKEYKKFVISDKLDGKLSYVGNVTVMVDGVALNPGAYTVIVPTEPENTLTVKMIDTDFSGAPNELADKAKLVVTFETVINQKAVPDEEIPNSADLTINNGYEEHKYTSLNKPFVVMGGRHFIKITQSSKPLAGAEFVFYRMNGSNKEYFKQESSMDVKWVANIADATKVLTKQDGLFNVTGVAYGEYFLKETKAPKNFNLLATDVKFAVEKGTYKTENRISVMNTNAPIIPVTGGIGTTLFYVGGGLLMGLSLLFIVVKRRKDKDEEVTT